MSSFTSTETQIRNFIGGQWKDSDSTAVLPVQNPATESVLGSVPIGNKVDVERAVAAATAAFEQWRRTPPPDRVQFLFKLKNLLELKFHEIAKTVTTENGKTLAEAEGELRRAIENVEVACGIPTLMQGYNLEDVAVGIDEVMFRQPLGVVAAITPFNFPVMIPFWFLPYAIACGNTFILKPSERVPLTMQLVFELIEEIGLPPGVVNLVNGSRKVADTLVAHPAVRAVSFVGSTPVARHIYSTAANFGKRVQCQGGAKNHVVVMPDADMEATTRIIGESAFGCAGQRCLAVSVAITVGDATQPFRERISETISSLRVGNGLEPDVQMGPVISKTSMQRIEGLIEEASSDSIRVLKGTTPGRGGYFVPPTIVEDLQLGSALTSTEIFGPVLSLIHTDSIDEAIRALSGVPFGNAASIFTSDGATARKFRYEVPAGNVGVNIGVAAPMAYFPFSGWRDSFFGVLHAQGRDAVEFYTEKKVVIERWPKSWSRKF